MSYANGGVEMDTRKGRGRREVYTHNSNQRFCKNELLIDGHTTEMMILNKIEGAAELFFRIGKDLGKWPEDRRDKVLQRIFDNAYFWYDMGAEYGGDFDYLYDNKRLNV